MAEEVAPKAHVAVLAFPGYGHISPMIQFARRLAWKGIKVTFATSLSFTKSIQTGTDSISVFSVYDDLAEGGISGAGGLRSFLDRFEESGKEILVNLIKDLENSECRVRCLVYDADLPWALDMAKELGIASAAFLTQILGSTAAYYLYNLKITGEKPLVPPLAIPDFSNNGASDLIHGAGLDSIFPLLKLVLRKFDNFGRADWMFSHTFDKLEEEVLEWMKNIFPTVRTIGPTVPSAYLDKLMEDNVDYGFNMNKSDNKTCLEWLNTKDPGSVVYVAFGSVIDIFPKQIIEMAMALKKLRCNFLWVMKETDKPNLPLNFIDETSEKGMVLTWCSQLLVLSHPAVGSFVTHCGANSIMEALVFGVPMVAMPKFFDQMPNSHFVEKVWGVGVNPKRDEQGDCVREEIERCVRELMYEEKGKEMKKKVMEWKKYAKEEVDEGGSSDKHVDEFIASLISRAQV